MAYCYPTYLHKICRLLGLTTTIVDADDIFSSTTSGIHIYHPKTVAEQRVTEFSKYQSKG